MTKKTAMFIGFLLSTSAMIVIIVFLVMKDKSNMKPMLFIGIGLALGSLILRNLLRFKPDWFKDNNVE
jgi:phosphatidylserine synthase